MSPPLPLVALAGSPNAGKTTLFNALTRSRARVGNYPGVTVERRIGRAAIDGVGDVEIVDLPGTYSLVARTAEEQIAVTHLLGLGDAVRPAAVVVCVDASQPVRCCYPVLQIQELGIPVVVALTMVDEAERAAPDSAALGDALGCPVVPVVAPRGVGLARLSQAVREVIERGEAPERRRWQPSPPLEREIARVRDALPASWPRPEGLAVWALSCIDEDDELLGIPEDLRRAVLASELRGEEVDDEVVQGRYRWLDDEVAPLVSALPSRRRTELLDRILLHRVFGFVAFLVIMFVVFQSLFAWADPAITLVETIFSAAGDLVRAHVPPGLLSDLVVDGLIAGVGSVLVFLPQIVLLFFLLGLMEDSGYMARVAYLMDRIMRSMNLHGRAFVPMLSGFACAVPAILATRTLERRRDRLLTMMVVPLMTCSARLPVYTLVIAALFPAGHVLGVVPVQGLLMVAMYVFSVSIALVAAWTLSRTLAPLRAERVPFLIELPPYRLPRLRDVTRMMVQRTGVFLREAGTVILACTIVLWALLSFPRTLPASAPDYDRLIAAAPSAEVAGRLESEREGELLRHSYAGRLGRTLEPAIAPLGFDWQVGVGLIGAFAAREVFVSTLGVVYSVGGEVDETSSTLREKMRAAVRDDGERLYTPLTGLSLMVFFALACQCMSTLAVVKRETGGYRWPTFLFVYMTALAWLASFAVYQGGRLLGFG